MDVINAIKAYVEKIVNDSHVEGMKVLLLDADTTKIVSMVFSQSEILEKQIFLVELLGTSHERMTHLKAIVFVRPTSSNLELLKRHLKDPKYSEYHLFFSNIASSDLLERLAEADELEVIHQVQEYYADYLSCNRDLFHLNLPNAFQLSCRKETVSTRVMSPQQSQVFNRSVEGIVSVLLSLKKKPIVRYQSESDIARLLANEVSSRMQRDGLFDFRRPDVPPVLLILDRKNDPVTPILSQWSYQAMVHELLGLHENRVDLRGAPGVRKDLQEVVLSVTSDRFFSENMHSNFGDLGMAVKSLVDDYQRKAQTHENIQSIEDMQRFVENYAEFRSESHNVSKHVALMGELARLVEQQGLMDVSQLEQELACGDDHGNHYKELMEKLRSGKTRPTNKLRLAMLYALRYETHGSHQIPNVKAELRSAGIPDDKIHLLDSMLKYAGATARRGDLYGDRGLKKYVRAVQQGIQGVPNVYAQHVPPLIKTLDLMIKGQLSESQFPIMTAGGNARDKVREIVVFITGGVTYEEAEKVAEMNDKYKGQHRIILGGSYIHNSKTFLADIANVRDNSSHMIQLNDPSDNWQYDGQVL